MFVNCTQHGFYIKRIRIGCEGNFSYIYIIDSSSHAIHTIGGSNGNHIIFAWFAKDAKAEVDGFIAAVAYKYLFGLHAFQSGYGLFEFPLVRVGIAIYPIIIRTLVGIKPNGYVAPLVLITCSGIRKETFYIIAYIHDLGGIGGKKFHHVDN